MTRKDYELIARAFTLARPIAPPTTPVLRAAHGATDALARELGDLLALDNPRFDRGRFLKACGVM